MSCAKVTLPCVILGEHAIGSPALIQGPAEIPDDFVKQM